MNGLKVASGCLAFMVGLGTATATSVMPVALSDAVGQADTVVQARVDRVETSWGFHLGEAAIVSRVWLRDEVVLKGKRLGSLQLFGGQLGDERMTLEGQPELREGEQVFLLVLDDEVQCPFVGIWQGVYKVVDGRVVREGRPVVDVVEGDAVLAQDQGIGMTARAFAGELKRLVGRAPGVDLDAVEVAVERGRKTISLRAPGSQLDPHGHPNGAHELRPTQPQGSATGPEVLR